MSKITISVSFDTEAEAAAFLASKGTPTASTGKTEKPAAEKKTEKPASKNTRDAMVAKLTEVKEKFDSAAAKAIISEVGGVAKMADIPDAKIDAVFDAAAAKLAEDDGM